MARESGHRSENALSFGCCSYEVNLGFEPADFVPGVTAGAFEQQLQRCVLDVATGFVSGVDRKDHIGEMQRLDGLTRI